MTIAASCRKCLGSFAPSPSQIAKHDFICNPCRNAYKRARVAKAKAAGTWNADAARKACREWRERNVDRERERERLRHARDRAASRRAALAYQKANPAKVRARVNAREKHIKRATPKWANLKAIQSFYEACPAGWHVDHIVPIKGKTVCGLHVENNLQHMPAVLNKAKGNKFNDW